MGGRLSSAGCQRLRLRKGLTRGCDTRVPLASVACFRDFVRALGASMLDSRIKLAPSKATHYLGEEARSVDCRGNVVTSTSRPPASPSPVTSSPLHSAKSRAQSG